MPLEMPGPDAGDSLVDEYGRGVSYMRLSVTDRCNLNCLYCRSTRKSFIPHKDILTYEEFLQLIGLAVRHGVNKIRLTGGEPFVRRDFLGFLERAAKAAPTVDLRLTTNGTLLSGKAKALRDIGITRLNISLDTLKRDRFETITGCDKLLEVRRAIDECLENRMLLKINAVALKGINDDELADFLHLAMEYPVDVRFIEFMPIGGGTRWKQEQFWSAEDILRQARRLVELEPMQSAADNSGPARVYALKGGQGRLGLISPLSNHFCKTCNRLRITSDGKLRTCLFSDREYRLRPALRSPKLGIEQAFRIMRLAGKRKPMGYELLASLRPRPSVCGKVMSAIGG